MSENKSVARSERYTPKYNSATTSYSAAIILSTGIFVSLYSTFITGTEGFLKILRLVYFDFQFSAFTSVYAISIQVFFTLIGNNWPSLILNFFLGWFIGGILAGFIYGKKARSGSIEVARILFKTTVLYLLVVFSFSLYSVNGIGLEDIIIGPAIMIFLFFLTLMSLPLALAALVGIQIGVILKNV